MDYTKLQTLKVFNVNPNDLVSKYEIPQDLLPPVEGKYLDPPSQSHNARMTKYRALFMNKQNDPWVWVQWHISVESNQSGTANFNIEQVKKTEEKVGFDLEHISQ